jgi:hypothetical protein
MNLQSAIDLYLPQPEVWAFIRKEGSQHCVKSHSGKNLGCYPSHGGAAKRLKQVEYFKKKHKTRMAAIGLLPSPNFPSGGRAGGGMSFKPKIGKGVGGFGNAPGMRPM